MLMRRHRPKVSQPNYQGSIFIRVTYIPYIFQYVLAFARRVRYSVQSRTSFLLPPVFRSTIASLRSAITGTGQSLGGSISEQLARSNPNINSIAFNRGSGPLQQFRKRPKNLKEISNRNDPLSYFSRSSKGNRKNNIINNKGWHSI